jgi:hypothetical protein
VIWYAYRSCMRQVSDDWVTGPLPSIGLLGSRPDAWRRVLFFLAPRGALLRDDGRRARLAEGRGPVSARCALRAFFHTLRAAADCLRARLDSRLASFTRLRARLSSSLAIRTRCRATSACRRARSSGSAGSLAGNAAGPGGSAPSLTPERSAPADDFSLLVFPMRKRAGGGGRPVSHNGHALATAILSTEFVNNPVHTEAWRRQSHCRSKGLHQRGQRLSSGA